MHSCIHCGNKYKTKKAYGEHYTFCNFYHNALKPNTPIEECITTPKMDIVFYYLQHLCKKIDKLENDNEKLMAHIGRKQDKTQIISWLNENIQGVDISDWTEKIDYDNMFPNILKNGIEYVLSEIVDNYEIHKTIKCVGNKFQYFCVYHKNEWKLWSNSKIIYILDHISNVFLDIFTKWSSEHQSLVLDDTEQYMQNYNKIVPRNLNKIYENIIIRITGVCKQTFTI
jgi:hypothetical protein